MSTHLNLGSSQLDGRSTKLDSGSTRLNFISFFISQEGTPLGGGGSLNSRGPEHKTSPRRLNACRGSDIFSHPPTRGGRGTGSLLHGNLLAIDNVDAGNELEAYGLTGLYLLQGHYGTGCADYAQGLCLAAVKLMPPSAA